MSKPNISCMWLEMNKCLVNPDGQVVPCCYMANTLFRNLLATDIKNNYTPEQINYLISHTWNTNPTLVKYIENKEDYNLNNRPINDILSDDWFNKDLPESWESYETAPHVCKVFCDKKENK